MKKSGVISVIVPVYGVEKYLEECIESLLNQTYPNLEVILIDDGSRDNCGQICDRYAQSDSRITVIHQKNAGAAAARNAGLRMASGEYLSFVDSDDYLEPDAYENLLAALHSHDADIVHGKFRYIYVNAEKIHDDGVEETVSFTAAEYLLHFHTDWTCSLSTVKLFRRHVLADVYYEEGHRIDDEFFTYQGVLNAKKILCIPTVVYNYRQRASSVMKNPDTTEEKCEDILASLEKRRSDVIGRFPQLNAQCNNDYADHLLWLAESDLGTRNTVKAIKKRLARHISGGRVLFWKKGQRKRFLRILAFLARPADRILQNRKEDPAQGKYQFFA